MTDFTTKNDINSRRRVSKTTTNQQLMDIGKMPPQAVELEEAVLGALMLEKDALTNVIDILKMRMHAFSKLLNNFLLDQNL